MIFNVVFYFYFCIQIQKKLHPIDMGILGGLFVGLKPYRSIACVFGFVFAVFSSFGITLSSKLPQIVHMPACDGYQPVKPRSSNPCMQTKKSYIKTPQCPSHPSCLKRAIAYRLIPPQTLEDVYGFKSNNKLHVDLFTTMFFKTLKMSTLY